MDKDTASSSTPDSWRYKRWAILGVMIFIGYLIAVAILYVDGHRAAARGERPMLTDFTSLYAASILVREQTAVEVYRIEKMYNASLLGAQAAYDGNLTENQARAIGIHPWMYPPTFIIAAIPLAYLSYHIALFVWLAVTAIPYFAAMRAIVQGPAFWLLTLAAPPVFYNIIYGQNGFLIAGLIGLGLAWLKPRPVLAGVCIGLASVKPHFGLLIPIALICGAHWKTFWSAVITLIGSGLLAGLLLGGDVWFGFIGTFLANVRGLELGIYKWWVLPSVTGALHQAGLDLAWAWRGQILAAMFSLAVVIWAWWWNPVRVSLPGLEAAILCFATLLAVPMVYYYDQMLMVPAMAWLWGDMHTRGSRQWEQIALIGGSAGLIGVIQMGSGGPIYGVLLCCLLLGLSIRRLAKARRPSALS
jgi:hypothetical protein